MFMTQTPGSAAAMGGKQVEGLAGKAASHWYDVPHLTLYATIVLAGFTGWLAWRTNDPARDSSVQLVGRTTRDDR
jgi:hypothetical protein